MVDFSSFPSQFFIALYRAKVVFTMAEFLRNIFFADAVVENKPVNPINVTDKLEEEELSFLCDVGLSNPFNKRYSTLFANGMNIKELFDDMTSEVDDNQMIGLSNGTKTPYQTKKVWSKNFDWNLSTWITDDKNPEQNVFVKVDGKNLKPEVVKEVSKL